MNPITIGLDVLLALLLLAALGMGARLNGRLKALRASYQGFAKAVGDLDAAAGKADRALKGLHVATEEAHDSLLARIETARALVLKLEAASDTAQKAALHAEDAAARAPMAAPSAPGGQPRRSLTELLAAHARPSALNPAPIGPRVGAEPKILYGGREVRPEREALAPAAAAASPRRRPMADEDLFAEAHADVRPELSGLMRLSLGRAR